VKQKQLWKDLGYDTLVKALRNCSGETQEEVVEQAREVVET